MARNRTNLSVRYPDAVQAWDQAITNNGLVLKFEDQNAAIAANFRLQRFRKAYRDTLAEGEVSVYDRFKVQVPPGKHTIIIAPQGHLRPVTMTTLGGTPVSVEGDESVPLGLGEDA